MTLKSLVIPTAGALALTAAPITFAGEQVGSLSCPTWKRVVIYSKASVWVEHRWTEGKVTYYNPYRYHKENNTGQIATGWKVVWDFEKEYAGAYCGSV